MRRPRPGPSPATSFPSSFSAMPGPLSRTARRTFLGLARQPLTSTTPPSGVNFTALAMRLSRRRWSSSSSARLWTACSGGSGWGGTGDAGLEDRRLLRDALDAREQVGALDDAAEPAEEGFGFLRGYRLVGTEGVVRREGRADGAKDLCASAVRSEVLRRDPDGH